MLTRKMRIIVAVLIAISALIYTLQILIFHDSQTTAFYIMQDLAFMPVSIAFTTIMLGELMNQREKKERIEKTRMLTSSFFTEMGGQLTDLLLSRARYDESLKGLLRGNSQDEITTEQARKQIREIPLTVDIDEENFNKVKEIIQDRQIALLVLSSNPVLLENEIFTEMLWGIFHLSDEFRLRGDFEKLTPSDIEHYNEDFARELRLLLINGAGNARYLRETYPNFYTTAVTKYKSRGKQSGAADDKTF